MNKIVNPCKCEVYGRNMVKRMADGYVQIELEDGVLSIRGVIGPKNHGNCSGSAGQCVDKIRAGEPAEGWTREMLDKLCDIWDKWHLNDMRAYCQHQRELGWQEQAKEEIPFYHYTLTPDASRKMHEAEKAAVAALKRGEAFIPSDEQRTYGMLRYSLNTYEPITKDLEKFYEQRNSYGNGTAKGIEMKARGWVRFDESEKGILCKPCPVCGYKYGTKWLKEEVPQEVIDWLEGLPETTRQPSWI